MGEKDLVAVRTCGGCGCQFDRRKVIKTAADALAEQCEFKFSYDLSKDEEFLFALLVNGCESACAPVSESIANLVIDDTNWERAADVVKEFYDGKEWQR